MQAVRDVQDQVPQERLGLDNAALPRRTGLAFPDQLPFVTWKRIGRQLSLISDASAWWLADWLIYGECKYTDRYKRAIRETSLDYQTLRNYAWVARQFPLSRRRDRLSMAHHAEVAALSEAEQDLWLDRAERAGWSRNELRRRLRRERSDPEAPELAADEPFIMVRLSVTPDREERWKAAADAMNRALSDWMAQVLDQAADATLTADEHPFQQPTLWPVAMPYSTPPAPPDPPRHLDRPVVFDQPIELHHPAASLGRPTDLDRPA